MENIYSLCFYGGLALAIIFLIVTVVLFVVLKIPKVVGDLTGRNAKKSIDEMRNKKVTSSDVSRKEQAKYYNQSTGKIKVKQSGTDVRKADRDDTTDMLNKNKSKPKWNDTSSELGRSGGLKNTGGPGNAEEGRVYNPDETEVLGVTNPPDETATEALGTASQSGETATEVLRNDIVYAGSENAGDDGPTDILKASPDIGDDSATEVLSTGGESPGGDDDAATEVLSNGDDEATEVLSSGSGNPDETATEVLSSVRTVDEADDDAATEVLSTGAADTGDEATDVLRATAADYNKPHGSTVIYNIVVTHTEEGI